MKLHELSPAPGSVKKLGARVEASAPVTVKQLVEVIKVRMLALAAV